MGTLQQELTKVQHLQNLDSMSFDDDDTEQQPAAEPDTPKRGMTSAVAEGEEKAKRHHVWDWVREHPSCTTGEVADGMDLSAGAAATIMYKLYERGLVTRVMHNGSFTYCTAVDEYPVMTAEEKVRRMQEANTLKRAAGLDKRTKRKYTKRAAPARAAAEKSTEQRRQVAVAPTVGQGFMDSVQGFINQLTVHQAKAVYEELRKVFGDFK